MACGALGDIEGAVGVDRRWRANADACQGDVGLAAGRDDEARAHGVLVDARDCVCALILSLGDGLVVRLQGEVLVGVHREGLGRIVVGEVGGGHGVAVDAPDGEAAHFEGVGAGSCCCRGLGDRRAGRGQGQCRSGYGLGHGVGGSSGRCRLLWGLVRSAAVGFGEDGRFNARSIGWFGRVGAVA